MNALRLVLDHLDFFTAVQEQLGLKLEATRGPVDVQSAAHPKKDDFEMPRE